MPDPEPTSLQLQRASFGDNRSKAPNTGKQLYVYHWNRIIAALVVVLILLVASVYAISLVFTDEKTTSQLSASESGAEQTRGSAQPPGPGPITDSQAEPDLGRVDAVAPNYNRPETGVNAVDADQATGPATPENALHKAQLDSETPIPEVPLAPVQVAETAVKPASLVKPTAASNSVFHLEFLQVLSPDVARFVLSSAVKDLEPVGRLQDITLHNNSAAKVFAYSDINNMKGEHLSYIWKHRDRIVNTVNIGVRSNRWRSYASKNIEQRLAGDWQLELRDSSDRLLAKAGFTFEPGH